MRACVFGTWHDGTFGFQAQKREDATCQHAKGGGVWHEVLFSGNAPLAGENRTEGSSREQTGP